MRPTFVVPALAAALVAASPQTEGQTLTVQPESRVWVEGTSTIRSFRCDVPAFRLTVDGTDSAIAGVLVARKTVRSVAFDLNAAAIDCHNGTMNEHMRKAIRAEESPVIHFDLSDYDVARAGSGVQGTIRGMLALGGALRPVAITATATSVAAGALRVAGVAEVTLSDFALKAPALMFGRIKVADTVRVRFDVVLQEGSSIALQTQPTS